jgi:hypothetical protein
MSRIFYDPSSRAVLIGKLPETYHPQALTCDLDGDYVRIWITKTDFLVMRKLYSSVQDEAGNSFTSAAAAKAYLDQEFNQKAVLSQFHYHEQTVAADTWTITHGFNRPVSTQVRDSWGCLVSVAVVEVDLNTVEVRSKVPFAGSAVIT